MILIDHGNATQLFTIRIASAATCLSTPFRRCTQVLPTTRLLSTELGTNSPNDSRSGTYPREKSASLPAVLLFCGLLRRLSGAAGSILGSGEQERSALQEPAGAQGRRSRSNHSGHAVCVRL